MRLPRWLQRQPHRHAGVMWDGFYEHCSCGACAGDRRDAVTGGRLLFFREWPEEALVVHPAGKDPRP